MARKSIQVKPGKDGWSVRRSGSIDATGKYSSKREATTVARRIASEQNLDVIIYERGRRFTEIRTSDPKSQRNDRMSVGRSGPSTPARSHRLRQNSLPEKRSQLWQEWAASHKKQTPALSDEAVSRESIYGDRG